jgi:hypothetical protein
MDGTPANPPRRPPGVQGAGAATSERALLLEIRGRQIAQDDRLARIERRLGLLGDRKELERLKAVEHAEKARAADRGIRRIERALGGTAPTASKARGAADEELAESP